MVAANGDFYVLTDADPGGKLSKYDALESAPIWETAFSPMMLMVLAANSLFWTMAIWQLCQQRGKAAGGGDVS